MKSLIFLQVSNLDTSAILRCLGATQKTIVKIYSLEMLWLATWWDVLAVCKETTYFDTGTIAEVEKFLTQPKSYTDTLLQSTIQDKKQAAGDFQDRGQFFQALDKLKPTLARACLGRGLDVVAVARDGDRVQGDHRTFFVDHRPFRVSIPRPAKAVEVDALRVHDLVAL